MSFENILSGHAKLSERALESKSKLQLIQRAFQERAATFGDSVTIFCAGSIGRGDAGKKSDLDMFVIAKGDVKLLQTYYFFSELIRVNEELGYPPFSNDGEFLKIYKSSDLTHLTGSREEDSQNVFTTRMLLLLESRPILQECLYKEALRGVVANYCRDETGHEGNFKPLFLLNDLLRYWRTLCLNYETIRRDKQKPWRKKNVNLKFSRMLTVFGTVLPLISGSEQSSEEIIELCGLTPLSRLARGLDELGASEMKDEFNKFLDNYEYFLSLKEAEQIQDDLPEAQKAILDAKANEFSMFLYRALTHSRIPEEYRKYLVI